MRKCLVLAVAAIGVAACGGSQPPEKPAGAAPQGEEPGSLVVRCGRLIDGLSDAIQSNRRIVIDAGRITSIGDDTGPLPRDRRVVDLRDHTCLPGLIDTHVHLALLAEDSSDMTIYYRRSTEQTTRIAEANARATLKAGFTTVRNVGDYFPAVVLDLKRREEAGAVVSPRIRTAGPYLTINGGGGDLVIPGQDEKLIPPETRLGVARGPAEFARKTQEAIDGGADLIKIIASGAVFAFGGVPGAPEMTREEIAAVVEVAHAAGKKVTAHAHGAQSIKDAILAGVDSIEHASLADDEALALAAEHGVALSMDVYNGTYTAEVGVRQGYPREFMRKNVETTETQRVAFAKAYALGVPILYGTDAGVYPHGLNGRQFEVMVSRGMKPMDAIKSATSVAADHMGLAADIGAIAVGRYGDVIAVAGNPLEDTSVLQSVDTVIKGGIVEFPDAREVADAVYTNGRIYTVDGERSWAEAVAIADGRIVYVGLDAGVAAFVGDDTAMYSLHGRLMLPAFQDVHIHPITSGLDALACDLGGLDDLAAYRMRIAEYAATHPDAEWISGGGWSMAVFGPGGYASRTILDELVPDRPVFLSSADGHSGWVNSVALEIAGITKETPDPPDGIIDRDPSTGELVGSLQEGAMDLVRDVMPEPTPAMRLAALEYARDMLHGYGITSIQAAYAFEPDLEAYKALDEAGKLDLRVVAALWWERDQTEEQIPYLEELRRRYTAGNLRATSVKIMQDGVIENYTAAMLEPYLLPSATRGIPMIEPGYLKDVVTALDAADFQVHFHAIGDAAVRQALDAIEFARDTNGRHALRHHVSHLQIIDPDDLPRFAGLGVVANFQPLWAYADDYVVELTIPFIGEQRARWMYPIKSVIDSGGTVAFGSDWSVSTANPFPQIETAITRVDADSHDTEVLNPEQRISIEHAIDAFTINAAFVNHQEDRTGSIEIGKLADLIVLDQDLFVIEPAAISDTRVLLTLFAGKAVYGDPASL